MFIQETIFGMINSNFPKEQNRLYMIVRSQKKLKNQKTIYCDFYEIDNQFPGNPIFTNYNNVIRRLLSLKASKHNHLIIKDLLDIETKLNRLIKECNIDRTVKIRII